MLLNLSVDQTTNQIETLGDKLTSQSIGLTDQDAVKTQSPDRIVLGTAMDGLRLAWTPRSTATLSLTELEPLIGSAAPDLMGKSALVSKPKPKHGRTIGASPVAPRIVGPIASFVLDCHSGLCTESQSDSEPAFDADDRGPAISAGLTDNASFLKQAKLYLPGAPESVETTGRFQAVAGRASDNNIWQAIVRVRLRAAIDRHRLAAAHHETVGLAFHDGVFTGGSVEHLVPQPRGPNQFTCTISRFEARLGARPATSQFMLKDLIVISGRYHLIGGIADKFKFSKDETDEPLSEILEHAV